MRISDWSSDVCSSDLKRSRGVALERFLLGYLRDDEASRRVRTLLQKAVVRTGPYAAHADFGDPGFMGTYALNVLDERNWVVVGDRREDRKSTRLNSSH